MIGIVKWFSREKGFGFLVGENERDCFFGVTDVKGSELPKNGDIVTFNLTDGTKGPKANNIVIKERGNSSDERVICPNCGKRIIPRVITGPPLVVGYTWTNVPKNSICPFCGKTYKEFSASLLEKAELIFFLIAFIMFIYFFFENFNSHHKSFLF